MENKIRMMNKVMVSLVLAVLAFWSWAQYGLVSVGTILCIIVAILSIVNAIREKDAGGDERGLQIQLLSAYCAFMVTMCFLLAFQAVEILKTGQINRLNGYTQMVMGLSWLGFGLIFRGREVTK